MKAKDEALFRLKTTRGQLLAVERMLAQGAGPAALLHQLYAARRALDGVSQLLIDDSIHDCLRRLEATGGQEEVERRIEELSDLYAAQGRQSLGWDRLMAKSRLG